MEIEQKKNEQLNPQTQNVHQIPTPPVDDSETFENSLKYKNEHSSIDFLTKNLQKSIGFFSKNMNIEEKVDSKRKYSLDEKLVIKKDFVPHLKPIEIHLVPSKLRLNKKGFKDLKCNKDNKILLLSNNYFISCPNSEEEELEEESDVDLSPLENEKNENIKDTRKNLHKMKSGTLPKVLSRNLIECKMYKEDMKIDYDSDKEDSNDINDNDDNDNLFLYDESDFINYKIKEKDDNDKDNNQQKKEEENKVRTNRINSCSILDVLKNKFSFDEPL